MHRSLRSAALMSALAAAAPMLFLAAPALAQFGPPPPPTPQTGPARIWNNATPATYVNDDAILSADLGQGGVGGFTAVLKHANHELCYILTTAGVDAPTAAHIHGADGKVVVPLATPADGDSGACMVLKPEIAAALLAKPGDYYVNVHNAAYPAGAVRGTLSAWDGVAAVAEKAPRG